MRLSRREVLVLAGGTTATVASPIAAQDAPAADPLAKAREENRRAAEVLARFEIPMSTEPAFIFRAST